MKTVQAPASYGCTSDCQQARADADQIRRARALVCHWCPRADFAPASPARLFVGWLLGLLQSKPAPLPRWSAVRCTVSGRAVEDHCQTCAPSCPEGRHPRSADGMVRDAGTWWYGVPAFKRWLAAHQVTGAVPGCGCCQPLKDAWVRFKAALPGAMAENPDSGGASRAVRSPMLRLPPSFRLFAALAAALLGLAGCVSSGFDFETQEDLAARQTTTTVNPDTGKPASITVTDPRRRTTHRRGSYQDNRAFGQAAAGALDQFGGLGGIMGQISPGQAAAGAGGLLTLLLGGVAKLAHLAGQNKGWDLRGREDPRYTNHATVAGGSGGTPTP